jgi:hypothetical protein
VQQRAAQKSASRSGHEGTGTASRARSRRSCRHPNSRASCGRMRYAAAPPALPRRGRAETAAAGACSRHGASLAHRFRCRSLIAAAQRRWRRCQLSLSLLFSRRTSVPTLPHHLHHPSSRPHLSTWTPSLPPRPSSSDPHSHSHAYHLPRQGFTASSTALALLFQHSASPFTSLAARLEAPASTSSAAARLPFRPRARRSAAPRAALCAHGPAERCYGASPARPSRGLTT